MDIEVTLMNQLNRAGIELSIKASLEDQNSVNLHPKKPIA
jgi:hypothetical protein